MLQFTNQDKHNLKQAIALFTEWNERYNTNRENNTKVYSSYYYATEKIKINGSSGTEIIRAIIYYEVVNDRVVDKNATIEKIEKMLNILLQED